MAALRSHASKAKVTVRSRAGTEDRGLFGSKGGADAPADLQFAGDDAEDQDWGDVAVAAAKVSGKSPGGRSSIALARRVSRLPESVLAGDLGRLSKIGKTPPKAPPVAVSLRGASKSRKSDAAARDALAAMADSDEDSENKNNNSDEEEARRKSSGANAATSDALAAMADSDTDEEGFTGDAATLSPSLPPLVGAKESKISLAGFKRNGAKAGSKPNAALSTPESKQRSKPAADAPGSPENDDISNIQGIGAFSAASLRSRLSVARTGSQLKASPGGVDSQEIRPRRLSVGLEEAAKEDAAKA